MKNITFILFILLIGMNTYSDDAINIKLDNDGFPTGHETPEGIACDLARALRDNNSDLFLNTCLTFENSTEYNDFIKMVTTDLNEHKKNKTTNPLNPKNIGKVFSPRHLSKDGPASYGYALFNFMDVMFVDIGVYLNNGEKCLNRTFVVKKSDNKWYVLPCPTISPLLSDGLNEESMSTEDFRDKYTVKSK